MKTTIELPEISIVAMHPEINQGEDAVYKVTASRAFDSDTLVNLNRRTDFNVLKEDGSGFSGGTGFYFPAGQTIYYYTEHIRFPQSFRRFESALFDGSVSMFIPPSSKYHVASMPNDRATVRVKRFERSSGVSIIADIPTNEGSEVAYFQVTASSPSENIRIVNVDVTSGNNNNYIVGTRRQTVSIPAGETIVKLDVSFTDDFIKEQDEYITATLKDGSGYTVVPTQNSASVLVLDDDAEVPVVRISESNRQRLFNEHWIEGNERSFTLFAMVKDGLNIPSIDVNVQISEDGGGSNYLASVETRQVSIDNINDVEQKKFEIQVPDNDVVNDDGSITVSILPGEGYEVSSTYNSVTSVILDDDKENEISIVAYDSVVTEGQFARFQINTTRKRDRSYSVFLSYEGGIGNFIQGQPKQIIHIPPTRSSRILYVPTFDDEIDESDGSVTVTLTSGPAGSSISVTQRTASVSVLDNDEAPVPPEVSLTTTNSSIVEGATVTIAINSDQAAPTNGLMVNYQKSQIGSFFTASFTGSSSEKIWAGGTSENLVFVTDDDNIDEPDGSFTISVMSSPNYSLGSSSSITINVSDNDAPPVISIADATAVVEGTDANAVFTLTATHPASTTRTINVSITGATGFIPTGQISTSVTLAMSSVNATLNVPIDDDNVDESDGVIIVTILSPTNAEDYQIGSPNVGLVSVADNDVQSSDVPTVTLSSDRFPVYEGGIAKILFTLDQAAPVEGLRVNFSIDEIGNLLTRYSAGLSHVSIPAGEVSHELSLSLYNDNIDEPDGSFTISLINDASYELGTTSSITVETRDNELSPLFTFVDATATYNHGGGIAEFKLQYHPNFAGTRLINVSINGVTRVIEGRPVPSTVAVDGSPPFEKFSLPSNNFGYAVFHVPIHDDQIREQSGEITATLLAPTDSSDYSVRARFQSISLNISDFDLPSSSPLPVVSVTPVTKQVFGDDDYIFRISTSHAVTTPLEINLYSHASISETSGLRGGFSITLPAGDTVYEFRHNSAFFLPSSFGTDNTDGFSEITVESGSGYIVGPRNRAKIIARRYRESPGISIMSFEDISESRYSWFTYAQFQITAPTPAQSDRIINVNVSDGDSDFLLVSGPSKVVLPAGQIKVNLNVPIENDNVDEPDGVITASILPGPGYEVAQTNNTASLMVIDNDGPRVIFIDQKISASYKRWVEGSRGDVNIMASGWGYDVETDVKFRVTDGGSNIYNGSEIRTLKVGYDLYYSLTLQTHDNDTQGDNGLITIEVLPGEGYEVSSTHGRATFEVFDDDDPVKLISIEAIESTITEGEHALFRFTRLYDEYLSYPIHFSYSDGSGDFIEPIPSGAINAPFFRANGFNFRHEGTSRGSVNTTNSDKTKIVGIPTVDDNIDESDGQITITLLTPVWNSYYYSLNPDATKNSVSVTVLDNDDPPENLTPVLTLSATSTAIIEGATATITITSDQLAPTDGIVASYQKSQTGNFFATDFSGSDSATILAGETAKNIEFVTHDDNIEEPDGSFTITLTSSTSYTLGTISSVTVNVTDNDDPPVISIADATAVVEGTDANAVFTLTASNPVSQSRSINVSITGATGFVQPDQIPTTATLDANSTTATLNIPIHNDEIDESDGIITVTISAPTNTDDYQIGSSNVGEVSVSDDDETPTPVVTLSTTTPSITEGDVAKIKLRQIKLLQKVVYK